MALKCKRKDVWILLGMGITLVVTIIASLMIGRFEISIRECLGILASKFFHVEPFWTQIQDNMITYVRIPRVLIAAMVGMALSVSGTSYQCIFRNPMAAPDVLGASTGAAFGAALAILQGRSNTTITIWAFVASIVCVALVMICAKLCKGNPVLSLVLSGIMIGSLFQAATSYLKLIADPHNTLPAITYWLMGSLSGASLEKAGYVWIPMLIGLIPIFALRWRMNLLTMEDDEARAIGVHTRRDRTIIILCSTLLTAASVSVSGIIGWVGLVIPHISRKMVGNDCRRLIPAAGLFGAIFMILVDDLARNLYTTELPLGILTAVIGAPFFIYLLARRGEW